MTARALVSALELGGDDYMVKPVKPQELIARIQANLRKRQMYEAELRKKEKPHRLEFGNPSVDTEIREVRKDGEIVPLSSIENDLLLYMIRHPGHAAAVRRAGRKMCGTRHSCGDTRTVMVHISNLRKKIDADRTGLIRTVRGAGYVFHYNPNPEGGDR